MTTPAPNPYLRTKVMTASPAELRMMLLDGSVKFLEQGIAGIDAKDYEQAYNGISRCQHILMELINSLQPEAEPELCQKLSALYTFMYTRLVTAITERDAEIAREVFRLLDYERETWALLMQQLKDPATPAAAESSPPAASPQPRANRVSVEG